LGNPRYIEPGSLVEVTTTCIQNRYLLRPSPELNEIFVGVLGKAQEEYDLDIVAVTAMSSHYHTLVVPEDQEQLSHFMCFVNGNLSKEVGHLHDWKGAMWASSYHQIPVDKDEATQVARLRYILAQGVKEGLVERPEDWPGVQSATALCEGRPLTGRWIDRTAFYVHREVQQEDVTEADFSEEVRLWFSPLPAWADMSPEQYQDAVAGLIGLIVDEAAAHRRSTGSSVLGADAVRRCDPHYRPPHPDRSPQPMFHTATVDAYRTLYKAFSQIFAAYRIASERLRAGHLDAEFPEGTFPCALPFVRLMAPARASP
jgi:REP element-mobilizing transposase RayT